MANSAWSGNTSGLATATSPGLVGITTQTFAGDKTFTGIISSTSSSLIPSGNVWNSKEYSAGSSNTIVTVDTGISATTPGIFSCAWFWGSNVNNGAGVCTFGWWGFLATILVGGTTTVNAGSIAFSNSAGQIRVTLTAPAGSNNTQLRFIVNGKYIP